MGKSKTSKRISYNDLSKVFGVNSVTIRWRLKQGMSLKETLDTPPNSYIKDLTGQKFSRLLVQYLLEDRKNGRKWHCLCDCGNECDVLQGNLLSEKQKSCGCLNMENRHNRHKDMSGKIINNVLLKRRAEDEIDSTGKHHIQYMCECPYCKEEFTARYANIVTGNTGGCGCTRHQYTSLNDLTGRDFEFCHVNKRLPNQIQPAGGSRIIYECTCCCGNIYSDWAYTILHGRSNCGCKKIRSIGESNISDFLSTNNISYIEQFWFDDLRGKNKMPYYFDFALFDDDKNLLGLIEFQGEQHYSECNNSIKDFGKMQREISDPAKRKYCKENSISLFEIRYNENIVESCSKIINTLYHDNTVPSSQETA